MLLAAADLTHQKTGIHDHACNDQRKKDDAEKEQHPFTPVEDDPPRTESDGECYQADAQAEEENFGSAAARDAHGIASRRFYRVRWTYTARPAAESSPKAKPRPDEAGVHST